MQLLHFALLACADPGFGGAAGPNHQSARAPNASSAVRARTASYLQLLDRTDWVSFVESRVQGWPGSLDGQPPLTEPFGLWWGGGDTITKQNGTVTFTHMGTDVRAVT